MGILEALRGPTSVTILPLGKAFKNVFDRILLASTEVPAPGKFRLDATFSQNREQVTRFTRQPVEQDALVVDHSIREPETLQVNGKISDTPLGLFGVLGIGGTLRNRALTEYLKLQSMYNAREPVLVATSLKVYERMVITSISTPRDPSTGGAIEVSISFMEMRFVRPLEVAGIEDLDALLLAGDGTVDTGTQTPRPYDGTLSVPGLPGGFLG